MNEIPEALANICGALESKETLVEVNFSDNAFGINSVGPLVRFLAANRHFQVLRLNNNGLGPEGGGMIAEALIKSAQLSRELGKTSNLRTIICGRNRLENGSAQRWANAFAAHGTLTEVRMPQNGIRMEGIAALARGLLACPNLEYVDFQDNTFTQTGSDTGEGPDTGEGSTAWAAALPLWPRLRTLNLSDCVISGDSDAGVPLIINALTQGSNPNLHTLQLQNNNLGADTFSALAEVISTHLKSLHHLDLEDNEGEEDDEGLVTLGSELKGRGGKLTFIAADSDDEDDVVPRAQNTAADTVADDLADLLGKVSIANTVP